jgi:hypothetical protein
MLYANRNFPVFAKANMFVLWQSLFAIICLSIPFSARFILHGIFAVGLPVCVSEKVCKRVGIADVNVIRSLYRLLSDCILLYGNYVLAEPDAARFNLQVYASISTLDYVLVTNAPWEKELATVLHHIATVSVILFSIIHKEFVLSVQILCMFTLASLPINLRFVQKATTAPKWALTLSDALLVVMWIFYRIPEMLRFTYIIFLNKTLHFGGMLMLILVMLHGVWSFEILEKLLLASKQHS